MLGRCTEPYPTSWRISSDILFHDKLHGFFLEAGVDCVGYTGLLQGFATRCGEWTLMNSKSIGNLDRAINQPVTVYHIIYNG